MNRVTEAMTYILAFDIGTENVCMWEKEKGLIELSPDETTREEKYTMPTATARRIDQNNKFIAVGRDALRLRGRSLQTRVEVIQPYEDGAILPTDDGQDAVRHLMEHGLERAYGKFDAKRRTYSRLSRVMQPSILTAITHCALEAEKQASENTIRQLNCQPRIVGQPVASAIGAGLPIHELPASFIVDIGGGTAGIAAISMMNIAAPPQDFKIGGRKVNRSIIDGIRKDFNMEVGEPTAEFLKRNVLSFLGYGSSKTVKGKPLDGGLPVPLTVEVDHMISWVGPLLEEQLITPLRNYLESLTPELYEDAQERGIHLTGGGSLIKGLPKLLKDAIGIEFKLVPDPLFSLVIGLGKMIENPKLLELAETSLLTEAEKRKLGCWVMRPVPNLTEAEKQKLQQLVEMKEPEYSTTSPNGSDDGDTVIMPAPTFQR